MTGSSDIHKKLIHEINEVFHDVESSEYLNRHDDVFDDIGGYWQKTCDEYLDKGTANRVIIDFGSGTGKTPLQISRVFRENDHLYCLDISEKMLEVCRKNLEKSALNCSITYLKCNPDLMGLEPLKADVIIINAVLHHIPEPEKILHILNSWLVSGGILVIGHEPGVEFSKSAVLWYSYRLGSLFFNTKLFFYEALIQTGMFELLRRPLGKISKEIEGYNNIISRVNQQLIEKKIVKKPLRGQDIVGLVDIHSATAGGFHRGRGIDLDKLKHTVLKNMHLNFFDTYMHLGKVYPQGKLGKRVEQYLKKKYPEKGAKFFAVFQKQ